MAPRTGFWVLDHLSNSQLLESLGMVLRTQHQALVELIAHLGEVEERRLHLEAAHASLFDYCLRRLGMSEDEACRRIELARLARRFPALFPLLATGDISLSVALVLKPALTADNHLELLASARGKSIRQARELVAARFPSPDVASHIRKLPERRSQRLTGAAPDADHRHMPSGAPGANPDKSILAEIDRASSAMAPPPVRPALSPAETSLPLSSVPPEAPALASPSESVASSRPVQNSRIEPLSAQRYKVQFTANVDLKNKLEQARALLRHAHPNGDFGPIVSRALDLLIADLLKKRFGVGARRKAPAVKLQRPVASVASAPAPAAGSSAQAPASSPAASTSVPSEPLASPPPLERTKVSEPAPTGPPSSAPVPREARRAVVARDGLSCTWVGADGTRCGSRAWLELDHRHPRGKGGDSQASNLRILCRAHNRFAAEREYGRAVMERAVSARQRACGRTVQSSSIGDVLSG